MHNILLATENKTIYLYMKLREQTMEDSAALLAWNIDNEELIIILWSEKYEVNQNINPRDNKSASSICTQ
jgi:hypothetical protein